MYIGRGLTEIVNKILSIAISIAYLFGGGGLVQCPRNTAPYMLANILELFSSFSLNTAVIGTTFSYVVIAFDGNFLLCMRSFSNANSNSGLDDAIVDQN